MTIARCVLTTSVLSLILGCAPADFHGDDLAFGSAAAAESGESRASLDEEDDDDHGDHGDHAGTDIGMGTDESDLTPSSADGPELSVRSAVAMKAACPTEAVISQAFRGGHDGVDLANRRGTPIFAVADGVVTDSGPAQGYGQWIRIRHDDGSMTESGHMYQRDVKVGDRVTAGQRIALMGSEGQSTGPHLHLRTYASAARTGSGRGMNPVEYLRARGVALPCKAGSVAPPPPGDGTFRVSVWKSTRIHDGERLDTSVIGQVEANTMYVATCFKTGQQVSAEGYVNDRWVKLTAGNTTGFISGIYLRGDETGGVTTVCK